MSLEKLEAQTLHMRRCFDEAVRRHSVRVGERSYQARVEAQVDRQYSRLDIGGDASIVRLVQAAATATGRTCPTRSTGGGSDANVFAERGLEVANLACGMREIHTVNEWVDVRDLVLHRRPGGRDRPPQRRGLSPPAPLTPRPQDRPVGVRYRAIRHVERAYR